jgi:hypothetical protein
MKADSADISGKWKASVRGDYYHFVFGNDSSVMIIHGTDTTNGKYFIDSTKSNPFHLDVHVYDRVSGDFLHTIPSIFEFVGKDRIRLRMSSNLVDRPSGFMPKGNLETLLLIRQL